MAKNVREPLLGFYERIKRYRLPAIAITIIAIALLAFGVDAHMVLFFPPLFLAAVFSTFYKRIVRVPPAFELISITTVAVGITHGAWAGALFGATAAFVAEILNGAIDPFIIGYVSGRAVMGALAGILPLMFPNFGIVAAGMLLLAVFNVIAQSLYLLQGDVEARMKTVVYVALNFAVNWWLFLVLGKPLIGVLK